MFSDKLVERLEVTFEDGTKFCYEAGTCPQVTSHFSKIILIQLLRLSTTLCSNTVQGSIIYKSGWCA